MAKNKSEEQVLFPDIKIDDVVIKPWSFGMLFELSELLDSILDKASKKGILETLMDEEGAISYLNMARVISLANEEILQIIATTIDRSYDEIKAFDMTKGVKVAMAIFEQNKEVLKNALGQMIK